MPLPVLPPAEAAPEPVLVRVRVGDDACDLPALASGVVVPAGCAAVDAAATVAGLPTAGELQVAEVLPIRPTPLPQTINGMLIGSRLPSGDVPPLLPADEPLATEPQLEVALPTLLPHTVTGTLATFGSVAVLGRLGRLGTPAPVGNDGVGRLGTPGSPEPVGRLGALGSPEVPGKEGREGREGADTDGSDDAAEFRPFTICEVTPSSGVPVLGIAGTDGVVAARELDAIAMLMAHVPPAMAANCSPRLVQTFMVDPFSTGSPYLRVTSIP